MTRTERTLKSLLAAGYTVEELPNGNPSYWVKGHNIVGYFAAPSKDGYKYTNGELAADHVHCFDKFSKCPLVVSLPNNKYDAADLTASIRPRR